MVPAHTIRSTTSTTHNHYRNTHGIQRSQSPPSRDTPNWRHRTCFPLGGHIPHHARPPPFILPKPKPLIDLYQLGNETTRTAQEKTLLTFQQLTDSEQTTTDQIDIAAKMVVETIDSYHRLAQTIWPMAQPSPRDTNTKLHPPITKSDARQLKRITRLRNTTKTWYLNQTPTPPPQPTPITPHRTALKPAKSCNSPTHPS